MTVSKYGKGLWKIDVSDGYDELTGERKRIRKTGFTSKKQAEEYEAHIKLFELRELKPKQKISIEEFFVKQGKLLKMFLAQAENTKIKPAKEAVFCPNCKKPMIKRKGKSGKYFWACTGYPDLPGFRYIPGMAFSKGQYD